MSGMPFDHADDIAAVLQTTGPRPAVPSDLAARVEARVRAHWDSEVQSRRRWRRLSFAAAVAAAIAIAVAASMVSRSPSPTPVARKAATVEMVVNSPTVLRRGDVVFAGTEFATGAGRIAMVLAGGQSLRLDANTHVTIVSDRIVALDRGAVYVDSHATTAPAISAIEVRTPGATVQDIGTQFEVRIEDGGVRVRVREGKAVVDERGTRIHVDAGQQVRLSSNGVVTTQQVDVRGFEWLTGVTPMMEIKGRTLESFLEWAARERGLRLEYSSAASAAAAKTIVLSGSIQGLTIDEAVAAVLATSQMYSSIEDGALHVWPLKESGARP